MGPAVGPRPRRPAAAPRGGDPSEVRRRVLRRPRRSLRRHLADVAQPALRRQPCFELRPEHRRDAPGVGPGAGLAGAVEFHLTVSGPQVALLAATPPKTKVILRAGVAGRKATCSARALP